MTLFTKRFYIFTLILGTLTPVSYAKNELNYVEVGGGATIMALMENVSPEASASAAPSIRLVVGGELESKNLWFETMYQFNGQFEDTTTDVQGTQTTKQIDTYQNHSVAIGIKATTNPLEKLSAYVRTGLGANLVTKDISITTSDTSDNSIVKTNDSEKESGNLLYFAIGAAFSFQHKTSINLDLSTTSFKYDGKDVNDTAVFLTYKSFL